MAALSRPVKTTWNFLRNRVTSCLASQLTDQITSSYNTISIIKQEILTFELIRSKLHDDLLDLQVLQQRIEYSKTFKGKYFHVLGHFFSLYCVWKIFISFINIAFNRIGKGKFNCFRTLCENKNEFSL